MKCPKCSGRSEVLKSNLIEGGNGVSRRRRCCACEHRWSTHEHATAPSLRPAVEKPAAAAPKKPVDRTVHVKVARSPSMSPPRRSYNDDDHVPFDVDDNYLPEC